MRGPEESRHAHALFLAPTLVLHKPPVDINGQLKRLHQELKFFAIVFKFDTELFVEYEIRRRVDPRDECNDLFDETRTLLDRPRFETVDGNE